MKMLAEIVDKYGKIHIEEVEREESQPDLEMEIEIKKQQIKRRLEELTKDFAQVQAGLIIPNLEDKKEEFRNLLNEIRGLEGKEPRETC